MTGEYTYLAADLATGNVLAELPLSGVKFGRVLNDAGTFSGSLALGDPRVARLDPVRATEPARTSIFVARDGVLVGDFVIWTTSYDSESQTLQIAGADPLSYFDHRKILPVLPPVLDIQTVARQQLAYSAADQLAIARDDGGRRAPLTGLGQPIGRTHRPDGRPVLGARRRGSGAAHR